MFRDAAPTALALALVACGGPPPPAPDRPVDARPPTAPPRDSDGDGLVDDRDACPAAPEDRDGFRDDDGCPDPDNDMDGIPDVDDQCPDEPEVYDGGRDDDGCPGGRSPDLGSAPR